MSELLPCPFCGSDITREKHSAYCYFTVIALGFSKQTTEDAWNTRAQPTPLISDELNFCEAEVSQPAPIAPQAVDAATITLSEAAKLIADRKAGVPPSLVSESRCASCDAIMELVRPGKYQHPSCPAAPIANTPAVPDGLELNQNEIRGIFNGRCIPGDMLTGESIEDYFVRWISDLISKNHSLNRIAMKNYAMSPVLAPPASAPAVPDDLAALVKQLVQALRKAAPRGALLNE